MCGDILRRELFLSEMIFLAEAKMHNALMNSLNVSIYGLQIAQVSQNYTRILSLC